MVIRLTMFPPRASSEKLLALDSGHQHVSARILEATNFEVSASIGPGMVVPFGSATVIDMSCHQTESP